jgi:hypothetical protein
MTERRNTSKRETEGLNTKTTNKREKKKERHGDVVKDSERRFEWETEYWVTAKETE